MKGLHKINTKKLDPGFPNTVLGNVISSAAKNRIPWSSTILGKHSYYIPLRAAS